MKGKVHAKPRKTAPLKLATRALQKIYVRRPTLTSHLSTRSNMSDDREIDVRPAKRARLDESAAHTPSTAATPQAAPGSALNAPSQIETDFEKEARAGITEYVCPDNLGFTGILKQRYTDFLVNEIGLDGQVLHLKSTQVEKKQKEAKKEEEVPVEVKPEEKIEIREEGAAEAAPAPVTPKEEKPAAAEPAAKAEVTNDGEETFAIASAPKKEVKEEVCLFNALNLMLC